MQTVNLFTAPIRSAASTPATLGISMAPSTDAKVVAAEKSRHHLTAEQEKKLHATAQSFESMFLNEMFEQMTADMPVDKMFGGGSDEAIYRSMQNEQLAKAVSKRGGIGIADAIYKEMLHMQESQVAPPRASAQKLS